MAEARVMQHELYKKYSQLWQFYLDAYQGTGPFADGSALVRFGRESPEAYANRKALAYYPNYCSAIVDFYVSSIFRRGVQRDLQATKPLPFEDFVTDVDRASTHLDDFMKTAALYAQIFGFCPVLVDMPREPEQPILTRLDQVEARIMPYFVLLSPFNVVNWEVDELGILTWVLIREEIIQDGQQRIERFRYIDRTRWEILEVADGVEKVVESGEHGLGVVPVVSVKNQPLYEDSFMGLSALRDISRVNMRLMNLYSELDQILRNQTFSLLVLPYDPEGKDPVLSIGTDNALRYPPEASHTPHFISPDASQGQIYLEAVRRLVDEIFRLARLEQLSVSRDMSGVAMSYYFRTTNDILAAKADQLEKAETALMRLWCLWQGADFTGVIHYPNDFDVRDVQSMISQALDLQALNIGSVTFERALRKQLVNAVLENVSDQELQKVLSEIDAASSFESEPAAEEAEALAGV